MTSVSVIWKVKFICPKRYIWFDFLPVASVLLHPKEEKALSLLSGVLISLAEVQSEICHHFICNINTYSVTTYRNHIMAAKSTEI